MDGQRKEFVNKSAYEPYFNVTVFHGDLNLNGQQLEGQQGSPFTI
jgi:hypothetical protein